MNSKALKEIQCHKLGNPVNKKTMDCSGYLLLHTLYRSSTLSLIQIRSFKLEASMDVELDGYVYHIAIIRDDVNNTDVMAFTSAGIYHLTVQLASFSIDASLIGDAIADVQSVSFNSEYSLVAIGQCDTLSVYHLQDYCLQLQGTYKLKVQLVKYFKSGPFHALLVALQHNSFHGKYTDSM